MSARDASAPTLPSKNEAAADLARRYFWNDEGLTRIIRLIDPDREDDPREPIKLLEVHIDAVPSGVILPLGFPAHPQSGRPFASLIVMIAPAELDQVRSGRLRLPDGWILGDEFSPPTEDENGAG